MTEKHEGGCFCGAIRYEFAAEQVVCANCHCSMCRRTSAAPFVTWLVVPVGSFTFTAGAPRQLASSEHGERTFCGDCGSPLTCFNDEHADRIDVTLGSLDEPGAYAPTLQVFHDTRLPWVVDDTQEYTVAD